MTATSKNRIQSSRIAAFSLSAFVVFALPTFDLVAAPAKATKTRSAKSGAAASKSKNDDKKEAPIKFLATPPTPLDAQGQPSSPSEEKKTEEAKKDEPPKLPDGSTPPPLPPLPETGGQVNPANILPDGRGDQLYDPVPSFVPSPIGIIPSPKINRPFGEPETLRYGIGRVIVKYEGDVAKKFKQLPSPEALASKPIPLAESGRVFYHIPRPQSTTPRQTKTDPAWTQSPAAAPTEVKDAASTAKPDSGKPKSSKDAKVTPPPAKPSQPVTKVVQFVPSEGGNRILSAEAILDIIDSVVEQINAAGIIAVIAEPNLNARDGQRDWIDGSDLVIKVSVSEVASVRTVARKIPFRTENITLINDDDAKDEKVKDKAHLWIKDNSPVKPGSLIDKQKLQNYLTRLNRFTGRRVDAALNASGEPGKVILDYLIKEQKPLTVYAQTGNTGTEATGLFRHRIGAEFRQLRNTDDIARFEYTTSEPSKFQSAFLSYETALVRPDLLKAKVYGAYGKYSAQDIGLGLAAFEGENLTLGTSLTWTPLYWKDFPLDITAGVEWFVVKSENLGAQRAEAAFILQSLGIGTDRKTDKFSLAIDLTVQASLGGPSQEDLDGLGRIETEGSFILAKWAVAASAYLEPFLLGSKWRNFDRKDTVPPKVLAEFNEKGGEKRFGVGSGKYFELMQNAQLKWWRGIRAHELAFTSTGQYVVGDSRLSPQLMAIAGGTNTVRGYPEAFTSGDNAWTASAEYRLHLARYLTPAEVLNARKDLKTIMARPMPAAEPAAPATAAKDKKGKTAKVEPAKAPAPQAPLKLLSDQRHRGFKFRPQEAGGEPDWDLILRVFADGAQVFNNNLQPATEVDRTLLSIGAGIEFQLLNTELYTTIRLDYGLVLSDEVDLLPDKDKVSAGDSRIHLSGTIAW